MPHHWHIALIAFISPLGICFIGNDFTGINCALKASTFINTLVLSQHEGGECLDDVVHIAKDKALRLVTNQQVPTPQAIGCL
jgi:hypothetical protein